MSVKLCRLLQIIAVALYALALFVCLLSIPFAGPLSGLFNDRLEIVFRVPIEALVRCLVMLVLSALFLIVSLTRAPRGLIIAAVVVVASLTVLYGVLFSPLISVLVSRMLLAQGAASMSAYSALNSAVSLLTGAITSPALILMFLSMGGMLGKDLSRRAA